MRNPTTVLHGRAGNDGAAVAAAAACGLLAGAFAVAIVVDALAILMQRQLAVLVY